MRGKEVEPKAQRANCMRRGETLHPWWQKGQVTLCWEWGLQQGERMRGTWQCRGREL